MFPLQVLWQGGGGQEVTSTSYACSQARESTGPGLVLGMAPKPASSPPVDFPRLCLVVAQESPKAAAVPLVPPAPSNASKPPILLHPKTLGWGCRYLGVLWGSITQSPGVRQTHSKGDPRAKDADRARLFSLAAFCCCIHGNTITRYIYIIYILLKLHNQCTKTGVHC